MYSTTIELTGGVGEGMFVAVGVEVGSVPLGPLTVGRKLLGNEEGWLDEVGVLL